MSNAFDLSRPTALHEAPTSAMRPPRGLSRVLGRIETILAVWRQRRRLAEMDASRLDDLGISAREAAREAGRPVWDVPGFWRH